MTEIVALWQQALEHQQAGRLGEASALCQRILSVDPTHAETLNLTGIIATQLGRADLALGYLEQAIRLTGGNAIYHNNFGQALMALGRLDEAVASFRQALQFEPRQAEAYGNLAIAFRHQGKTGDAILLLKRAIELRPDFGQAHNNLANLMAELGQLAGALEHYDRALAVTPDDPQILVNRGGVLLGQNRIDDAVASFRRAHALRPDDALLLKCALALPVIVASTAEIAQVRRNLYDSISALGRRGLVLTDPEKQIGQTCFHLAYHAFDDLPLQRALAALYAASCPTLTTTAPHCREPATLPPDGRIRIGFASHFFRTHTIARLFHGQIATLSRGRFHVTLLTTPGVPDPARSALIEATDAFVELPLDLAAARQRIADCALDVLVYPDIGMSPLTYFLAFARLAPVQCVSWGHPDSTGIANLDYFLSCDAMEPDDAAAHYSEQLVRLPGPTVFYPRPMFDAPLKRRAELGLDAAAHLYTCPQSLFKFHPDFDAVLVEILRRDPTGRLVLVQGVDRQIDAMLIARLTRDAPDIAARIVVMPALNRADFVALLAVSDVMLDPLHYSGGNTSLEAFSVGTPIVTWPGEFMRGRHTYGFYRLMDLDDCVARDPADYVAIALRLGTDPAARAAVSARIRAASAVLYENAGSIRALEDFLVDAVARARSGRQLAAARPQGGIDP
jgi:predicted O-linked N-acetylglucosamine transferase (SPINDLY family)